jgi:tetratricopeptide (TPR) repeat protein
VHWFVTTLLKTPGHAPADPIAAAPILNDVEFHNGAARAEQKLREARRKDPQGQLWPEISMAIVGLHFLRDGAVKSAIEVLKLNLLAYPDSADATENLAEAYLAAGDKVKARQAAQKSIEMLDSRKAPASTWTDTEQYRGEIREGAQKVLKQVDAQAMSTSERSPGSASAEMGNQCLRVDRGGLLLTCLLRSATREKSRRLSRQGHGVPSPDSCLEMTTDIV